MREVVEHWHLSPVLWTELAALYSIPHGDGKGALRRTESTRGDGDPPPNQSAEHGEKPSRRRGDLAYIRPLL